MLWPTCRLATRWFFNPLDTVRLDLNIYKRLSVIFKGLLRYFRTFWARKRLPVHHVCARMWYDWPLNTLDISIYGLNTLDVSIYVPRNSPNTGWMSKRTTRLCDDPDIDHIAIGLLSLLIRNHTIPYLLHATLKFETSHYFPTVRWSLTKTEWIPETATSPQPHVGKHSTPYIDLDKKKNSIEISVNIHVQVLNRHVTS